MKRALFFTIIIGIIINFARGAVFAQAEKPAVHFVVIGDRTGGHVPGIYEEIVAEIERLHPDFVVTVGDMIEGYSTDTVQLQRMWDEYKKIIAPLTMPIYFTPGNHDITYDAALGTYRKNIGEPYHSFDAGGIHFISLDNSRWESSTELSREQIDWLAADLKAHKDAPYTAVLYHKPFWYNSTADNHPDTLHALFKAYGVDAVFTGHFHQYFSAKYDGIMYTCVGSSGGSTDGEQTGMPYHFLWVTVGKDGMQINPVKIGSVLPWDYLTVPQVKLIDRMNRIGITMPDPLAIGDNLMPLKDSVNVIVRNISRQLPLADTLRWDLPSGWKVDPAAVAVSLKPGDSLRKSFVIRMEGALYPAPSVSMAFPYDSTRKAKISRTVSLQRREWCYKADQRPVIDGQLTDAIWNNPVYRLYDPDGNVMTIDSAYFYFIFDDSALYLGAICREGKMDSMAARVSDRDGAIYSEDCVGYFIQPDRKKAEVYQIYFNPLGTIFDQKITVDSTGWSNSDRAWNCAADVKTYKGNGFWSTEVRLPWAQFGVIPKAGSEMGLNFRRKQLRFGSSADWQVPLGSDPEALGLMILK